MREVGHRASLDKHGVEVANGHRRRSGQLHGDPSNGSPPGHHLGRRPHYAGPATRPGRDDPIRATLEDEGGKAGAWAVVP